MKNKKAIALLEKYKQGNCTEAEKNLIEYWAHHLNESGNHGLSEADLEDASVTMWAKIDNQKPAKVRQIRWPAVAAAVLLFAALAVLFKIYVVNTGLKTGVSSAENRLANTIKVGGNKAVLTLANGKKVILDDLATAHITDEDGVRISKTAEGQLIYTVLANKNNTDGKVAYNTITTPKGGQYQVNLPDGSKVWLNAATTLRFPLTFQQGSRLVELSGEGYFEVKHLYPLNGQKVKFMVKTMGRTSQMVEVLGTHFNINAYTNEDAVKTTLLEGSVRVGALADNAISKQNTILKPGEQSVLANTRLAVVKADTEDVIAWKNGYFRFNDESLESIMRKVERWYNVDVRYDDDALKKISFAGVTTRFANVAELLKMLELTGEVKFRIDGNSIVVLGKK
ncbi:FecR family protein [Mucilaginibacter phyllosphaerae]|uniref:FecR family protein n=1 Tax=Mucilaginibacter phyllosphaerae TaxID=1812349 RepID=A0A4Y8ABX3_9SPHI|nr:FecR domain-containing protein [Mucilaginibacter phyllosphaerae]MBB3969217.1 ferric-dicitrate binding protein FerR (iron transport regulator) [Mucilaginibacter phyllosphaerae]TEW65980.1 FecR family protein [Mucilaginibacter phyllosphaerae]GGH07051.1 iron dicitrate transporter FecR [Mucilaginibacter phyllosphaerae]